MNENGETLIEENSVKIVLKCQKFMIRLLRHDDTVHREDDEAVRIDDLAEKFKAKFDGTAKWPIEAWITFLAKRRKTEEKVSVLL